MTIRKNSIVVRRELDGEWSETDYRVEDVDGRVVTMRNLDTYKVEKVDWEELTLRYQTDTFERGDTVRIRKDYSNSYNEVDGANTLMVVRQKSGNVPTTVVRNNNGDEFSILNERLQLVRPVKAFKAGDRVVVDLDLMEKFGYDGIREYWTDAGVMVLTEDSGSRPVKYTSHIRYENRDDKETNNVPTRWLKLYVEPAKRVVGETIKAEDIKVGDKVVATDTVFGVQREFTGVVGGISKSFGATILRTEAMGWFPSEYEGAVYTLLEEAPEPVDENLQRLLDAEVGDIAHSTYAHEYWEKMGKDMWGQIREAGLLRTTDEVFDSFYKMKYGKMFIFRKVEDGAE